MLVRQTFQPSALASSTSGLVLTATANGPAGGVGSIPLTLAPGNSPTAGTAAILVVNQGPQRVSCRWWLASNGPATPHLEDFGVGSGQSVAVAIPAFGPDTLVFYTPGNASSLGIIDGHIVATVEVGTVDVVPAAVGS